MRNEPLMWAITLITHINNPNIGVNNWILKLTQHIQPQKIITHFSGVRYRTRANYTWKPGKSQQAEVLATQKSWKPWLYFHKTNKFKKLIIGSSNSPSSSYKLGDLASGPHHGHYFEKSANHQVLISLLDLKILHNLERKKIQLYSYMNNYLWTAGT